MNKNVVLVPLAFLFVLLSLSACVKYPPPDDYVRPPGPPPVLGHYVFVGETDFRYDHQYTDDTGKSHWDIVDTVFTDTIDMTATADLVSFGFRPGTPTTAYEAYFSHSFPATQYPSYSYGRLAYGKSFTLRSEDSLFSKCDYHMVAGGYTSVLVTFKGKKLQ